MSETAEYMQAMALLQQMTPQEKREALRFLKALDQEQQERGKLDIEAAAHDFAPDRYRMDGKTYTALIDHAIERNNINDVMQSISAAYNMGFKRGRNYERNRRAKEGRA